MSDAFFICHPERRIHRTLRIRSRRSSRFSRGGVPRWLKFNLVGLGGVLVQLGLLEAWTHFSLGNYLLGTALAVEAALLHNFGWHCVYTWRDRPAANATTIAAARTPLPPVQWRGLPARQPASHAPVRHRRWAHPFCSQTPSPSSPVPQSTSSSATALSSQTPASAGNPAPPRPVSSSVTISRRGKRY